MGYLFQEGLLDLDIVSGGLFILHIDEVSDNGQQDDGKGLLFI